MENQRKVTQNIRPTLENYIKGSTPVKTGNLRNSVDVRSNGDDLEVYTLEYGKYVLPKNINTSELNKKISEYAEELIEGIWNDMAKDI